MDGDSGLQIDSVSKGPVSYLRLVGTIDKKFDPASLVDGIQGRNAIVDLEGVIRIDADGVRLWLRAIEILSKKVERLLFVDCSPAVVAQLNRSAKFRGPGTVVSVRVLYVCKECFADEQVHCDLGKTPGIPKPKHVPCKRCSKKMVPDEDPKSYFAFRRDGTMRPLDDDLLPYVEKMARIFAGEDVGDEEPKPKKKAPVDAAPALGVASRVDKLRLAWGRTPIWLRAGGISMVLVAALLGIGVAVGLPMLETAEKAKQRHWLEKRGEVMSAFRAEKYAETIDAAQQAAVLGPLDVDIVFVVGESYRLLSRLTEAIPHYEEVAADPTADHRLDDALFWQAEWLLSEGRGAEARVLYKKVLEQEDTNFVTSANERIAAIDKESAPRTTKK